jgi:hypothetical protein
MIDECELFTAHFKSTDEQLEALMAPLRRSLGITDEAMAAAVEALAADQQ